MTSTRSSDPSLPSTVADELRVHRAKRAEELLRLGMRLSDDDLVIAQADGSIVPPIYISQLWGRVIARTKLARLRFHDLCHAHATHTLARLRGLACFSKVGSIQIKWLGEKVKRSSLQSVSALTLMVRVFLCEI